MEADLRKQYDREAKLTKRKEETLVEADLRKQNDREAKSTKRKVETLEESTPRKRQETLAKEKKRAAVKSMPTSMYAARNAQKVLYGEQIVHELEDSKDRIGPMNIKCAECGALKWKTETATVCCNNGKVYLSAFPDPPKYLQQLWTANTIEARLFRE